MMVLLDTNVVLDVLLSREPHSQSSYRVLSLVETGVVSGVVCATSVTTIFYFAHKALGRDGAFEAIRALLQVVGVAPVSRQTLEAALGAVGDDFEDNVVHESGRMAGVDAIITRDARGFRSALCPVMTPAELVAAFQPKH